MFEPWQLAVIDAQDTTVFVINILKRWHLKSNELVRLMLTEKPLKLFADAVA
jgi:hypothetical protein